MILNITVRITAEEGRDLDSAEVAKDLELYAMDFAQNVAKLEPDDIEGGFYVLAAKAVVI